MVLKILTYKATEQKTDHSNDQKHCNQRVNRLRINSILRFRCWSCAKIKQNFTLKHDD